MRVLSDYSYLLLALLLVGAGIAAALLTPYSGAFGVATLLVATALVIYWVAARRGKLTPVNPVKRIRKALTTQRPVVVHFYSDFSLVSLLKRPFTARAERAYRGKCDFIYIDVRSPEAEAAMAEVQAEGRYDFVLFDAAGKRVGRSPMLSEGQLSDLLRRAQ
jgi:hypothetical protein